MRLILIALLSAVAVSPPIGGQDLKPEVQGDLLKQRIVDAYGGQRKQELLDLTAEFSALEARGVPVPAPIRLVEARTAAEVGAHTRALCALKAYLNMADRDDPAYASALADFGPYETAAKSAPSTERAVGEEEYCAAVATNASRLAGGQVAPQGTGTIIFFRDKKFGGSAATLRLREGDREIGQLSSGTYFSVEMPAGTHSLAVDVPQDPTGTPEYLEIDVQPNATAYVAGWVTPRSPWVSPHLSPADVASYSKISKKLKPAR